MKRILDDLLWIKGEDEFIPDSHMYVIGDIKGDDITLVDAGLIGKGSYKMGILERLGVKAHQIRRIIMTHCHLDHIGCLPELKRMIPQMEVWVHELEAVELEAGDERTVYGMELFKTMAQAQFRLKDGIFKIEVHRKLKDGDLLSLGSSNWSVLHLPGHSKGSIGLYEEGSKVLVSGDTLYSDYAIGRFDLYGADSGQLKASLRRLAPMEIHVLLPAHNRPMEVVPQGYVQDVLRQWEAYL